MTEPKLRVIQPRCRGAINHDGFDGSPWRTWPDAGLRDFRRYRLGAAAAVYEQLRWLMSPNVLPFPVHVVSAGNIRSDALAGSNTTGGRFNAAIPWHMLSPKGKPGMGRRQCTKEYKLRPIQRKIVELMGGRPKGRCGSLDRHID